MKVYHDALEHIMNHGLDVTDRTGVGTRSVFGHQMRFDIYEHFPAITTKRLAWRSVVGELLWMLEGSTDERRLAEIIFEDLRENLTDKSTIWTANANAQGAALGYYNDDHCKELGPVYGYQWRCFGSAWPGLSSNPDDYGRDQISWLIDEIKNNPDSRRLVLSAWEPNSIDAMALPPCHMMAQFRVYNDALSCLMYQRSADMFLGVPFNIASYSLLTHMLAQICNLDVGEFIWTGGDCHVYHNHFDQVQEQLSREPTQQPLLSMPAFANLTELLGTRPSDYELIGYEPHPAIRAPMAV